MGYALAPTSLRNPTLLLASLAFYYWGAGAHTLALFWVAGVTFVAGRTVRTQTRGQQWVVIGATLAPLVWFKYSAFATEIATSPLRGLGWDVTGLDEQLLPVGISFFTFQALSYFVDIKRGHAEPLDGIGQYLLYISLFPQLIAGPIVRFSEIREQLNTRRYSAENLSAGSARFALGLSKKVVIADSVAPMANVAFNGGFEVSSLAAWIGVSAYTVQIYFDFSGYSDMAIGLGRIFGFRFPENFARPYSSKSVTEFWRRWHITLSNWFRDYVYIPLGGSRGGRKLEYRNLAVVFLLTALWHGAAYTFLIWGAIHGAWLILERTSGLRNVTRWPVARRALTLLVVMVAWVFFRASEVDTAASIVVKLFAFDGVALPPELLASATPIALSALALGLASFALPASWVLGRQITEGADNGESCPIKTATVQFAVTAVALLISFVMVASNDLSPFLYFQF